MSSLYDLLDEKVTAAVQEAMDIKMVGLPPVKWGLVWSQGSEIKVLGWTVAQSRESVSAYAQRFGADMTVFMHPAGVSYKTAFTREDGYGHVEVSVHAIVEVGGSDA